MLFVEDVMSKKIVIFLVGVRRRFWENRITEMMDRARGKTEDIFLDGLTNCTAPEKCVAEFETRYFDGFSHAVSASWESRDVDMICIADQYDEIGFKGVADGLELLAKGLKDHPCHPAVDLFDRRMYPLAESLVDAGVKVIADDPKEFWRFVAERYALKNKPEDALQ